MKRLKICGLLLQCLLNFVISCCKKLIILPYVRHKKIQMYWGRKNRVKNRINFGEGEKKKVKIGLFRGSVHPPETIILCMFEVHPSSVLTNLCEDFLVRALKEITFMRSISLLHFFL